MSEFIPEQDTPTEEPRKVLLISSANTEHEARSDHTTIYYYREDPKINYCIEIKQPGSDFVERIFTNDGRIYRTLYDLGYTAVHSLFATNEQQDEYHTGCNESKLLDWDVLDPIDKASITLESTYSMDEESDATHDIPRTFHTITLTDELGNEDHFNASNTFIYKYSRHPHMNNIQVATDEGPTELLFEEEQMIEILEQNEITVISTMYPTEEIVDEYMKYQSEMLEHNLEVLFNQESDED